MIKLIAVLIILTSIVNATPRLSQQMFISVGVSQLDSMDPYSTQPSSNITTACRLDNVPDGLSPILGDINAYDVKHRRMFFWGWYVDQKNDYYDAVTMIQFDNSSTACVSWNYTVIHANKNFNASISALMYVARNDSLYAMIGGNNPTPFLARLNLQNGDQTPVWSIPTWITSGLEQIILWHQASSQLFFWLQQASQIAVVSGFESQLTARSVNISSYDDYQPNPPNCMQYDPSSNAMLFISQFDPKNSMCLSKVDLNSQQNNVQLLSLLSTSINWGQSSTYDDAQHLFIVFCDDVFHRYAAVINSTLSTNNVHLGNCEDCVEQTTLFLYPFLVHNFVFNTTI